jgi:hypothetical protein
VVAVGLLFGALGVAAKAKAAWPWRKLELPASATLQADRHTTPCPADRGTSIQVTLSLPRAPKFPEPLVGPPIDPFIRHPQETVASKYI